MRQIKLSTKVVTLIATSIALCGCGGRDEAGPPIDGADPHPGDATADIQVSPGTFHYFDLEAYGRREEARISLRDQRLHLQLYMLGSNEESHFVRVQLTNGSNEEHLVVPIHPQHYQLEIKLPDGTIESLTPLPPYDYPIFTESRLVRLYPGSSVYADYSYAKSRHKQNASYRVSVNINIQLATRSRAKLVRFQHSSPWILHK